MTARLLRLAVLSLLALPAFAQTDRIDERLANQERRIREGEKSGALTAAEARTLRQAQQKIREMKAQALADGKITPEERARIEKEQDRQSREIRKEKHDKEVEKKKKG